MITDLDRDIVTIKYNLLNLPELIQFKEGHQIKHLYDATGKKLETQYITLLQGLYNPLIPGEIMDGLDVNEQDLVTINGTAYIDNMEYHLNRYFDWDVSYAPKSVFTLNRVHNPEGYTTYANLKLNKTGPIYHYYRRDHLGNNREVWQAEHLFNNKPKLASTIQRTQYYPSGLPWKSSTADGAALQPYKYGGKEFVETHGYDSYDFHARNMYPAIMRFTTIDPLAVKYYSISPYAYVMNNPIRFIDPDGCSTRVALNDDGIYRVIGGNLNDKDYNIYVYTQDKDGNYTVKGQSIGVTTSLTSFYNSDGNAGWMGTINTQDNSGELFLSSNVFGNKMTLDEYMANASLGEKYDFKSIGFEGKKEGKAYQTYVYRGTNIGAKDGIPVYTSARDVGNIAAGYVAGSNGISWKEARVAFDLKQGGLEGVSTRNAEYWGWKMGVNNSTPHQRVTNFENSLFGIWDMLKGLFK